jgi:hypothetical protein
MAESTPGSVHIAWYATGFRADKLEKALAEIVAVAPRYGATHFELYRSRDDRYRFLQVADFASKLDWERYWSGPEFTAFRTTCSSWYQVPVTYAWLDIVAVGGLTPSEAALEPVAE